MLLSAGMWASLVKDGWDAYRVIEFDRSGKVVHTRKFVNETDAVRYFNAVK